MQKETAQYIAAQPLPSPSSWKRSDLIDFCRKGYFKTPVANFHQFQELIHNKFKLWFTSHETQRQHLAPILSELWQEVAPNICRLKKHRKTGETIAKFEYLGVFYNAQGSPISPDFWEVYNNYSALNPSAPEAQEIVKNITANQYEAPIFV
jgi:hypothetical protein